MNADFENQFVLIIVGVSNEQIMANKIAKNAKSKRTKPNKIANKAKCRQVDDIRSLSSDHLTYNLPQHRYTIQSENFRIKFSKNRNQKVL